MVGCAHPREMARGLGRGDGRVPAHSRLGIPGSVSIQLCAAPILREYPYP
jgi:hypothetical protein